MNRVWNFSSGPAILPESVIRQASHELMNWNNCGMSVLEMSHRGQEFTEILQETQTSLRKLLQIPNTHEVLWMQGGAIAQNAIIPIIIGIIVKYKSVHIVKRSNIPKMIRANSVDIVLFANGLFFVRNTCLSKSLSKKSFITQPELLARTLPTKSTGI